MKLSQLLIAAAASAAISGAASAAVLTSSTGSPLNTVTNYSAPALVAFDLDLENFAGTRLNFMIEADDLLGPLSMNALVRNLSGDGLTNFTFALDGIAFSMPGSVTPTFGTVKQVTFNSNQAGIYFAAPEWAELHFGNPFAVSNESNWLLDTAGLKAGDVFSITASVPEPSTVTLLLSALAMFGVYAHKVRNKR